MFLIVTKLLVLSLIIDKYLIILFILTIESSDPEVEYRVKKGKFNYKKKNTHHWVDETFVPTSGCWIFYIFSHCVCGLHVVGLFCLKQYLRVYNHTICKNPFVGPRRADVILTFQIVVKLLASGETTPSLFRSDTPIKENTHGCKT